MPNLKNYSFNQVLTFEALLQQFLGEGKTDIRTVQVDIDAYIQARHKEFRNDNVRALSRKNRLQVKKEKTAERLMIKDMIDDLPHCPSCNKSKLFPAKGVNEPVYVCPNCRYSQYEGVNNELYR